MDIYASCYGILEEAFGERMAAPESLLAAVADGSHGTKAGRGLLGSYDEDALSAIREYRDRAYVQMASLQDELGTPPGPSGTTTD